MSVRNCHYWLHKRVKFSSIERSSHRNRREEVSYPSVLKRLAGSKWGCAWSTLNMTYQKYILPLITHSCESLVTAQPHTLKVLEHAQNQALRLITGAVKTTPTDAMTFITDNKPIQELIEDKAVLLHEKLLESQETSTGKHT